MSGKGSVSCEINREGVFHHYSLLLALPNSSHKGLPPGFGESNPTWGGHRSPKHSQRQKETWKYFNTYQTMRIVDLQDNVVMLDAQLSSPGCSLLQSQSWWTVWCLLFCLSSHPKHVVQDTSKIILIVLAQTGQLISGLSSSVSAHCSETWHLARSLFERIGGNCISWSGTWQFLSYKWCEWRRSSWLEEQESMKFLFFGLMY